MSRTTVSDPGASPSSAGPYAAGSWPETTAKPWQRPRWVTGMPARAGAAIAEEIPGTTSKGTPAAARASPSSPPRPNTKGSPHFSRTTRLPARAARTRSRSMVRCETLGRWARLPTEKHWARGASFSASASTSAS